MEQMGRQERRQPVQSDNLNWLACHAEATVAQTIMDSNFLPEFIPGRSIESFAQPEHFKKAAFG